ncbi:hypothetical protein M758_10G147700 [Ceratodon purpureus]|uniref:Uncharacterized protein n=1 Tax=Ceratodon purpureus TaxID=3225 RepID=A0A8T0GM41_CERPU|nr:hypothetical protein KC19_10G153200 [Ceratodon purpureus]KAG0604129.1 hypothetical protein M758_10G147700 [Ceratodon purpureus]
MFMSAGFFSLLAVLGIMKYIAVDDYWYNIAAEDYEVVIKIFESIVLGGMDICSTAIWSDMDGNEGLCVL